MRGLFWKNLTFSKNKCSDISMGRKVEIMKCFDRQAARPTNRQKDMRGHRQVFLPIRTKIELY